MNSRRMAKASEAIRETVSTVVLFQLRDPRVKNVTVLSAEVSADLRAAKVRVTIMGDAKAQSLAMHGLESARGFIQAKVAERLQTKNTPILKFILDPSVKKSIEVSRALQDVQMRDREDLPDSSPDAFAQSDEREDGHNDELVDLAADLNESLKEESPGL